MFTAAEVAKVPLRLTTATKENGKWDIRQVPCLLVEGDAQGRSMVFGANAICWHLLSSQQLGLGSQLGLDSTKKGVVSLLQWEEQELEPMVGMDKIKRSAGGMTCLGRVLDRFTEVSATLGSELGLDGNTLILDVCIASTLTAMKDAACTGDAVLQHHEGLRSLLERVEKSQYAEAFRVGRAKAKEAMLHSSLTPKGRVSNAPVVPGDAVQQQISHICKEAVFRAFPLVGEEFEVHVEPGKVLKKDQRPPELQ